MTTSAQTCSAAEIGGEDRLCPECRGSLRDPSRCDRCGRSFPPVAGIADLRLASDRYLSLAEERGKAAALAEVAPMTDLAGLSAAYYEMTSDVDARRRVLYRAHIARGEARGEALAAVLPRVGRVLEVGCGTGGLLVAARRLGIAIEGVDIASRWLVLARKRMDEAGMAARLTAADAARLPWPDATFACVVADSVVEHLDDPSSALAEWLRVVRPGGRLVLWSPNRYSLLPDPHVGLWGLGWLPSRWQSRYVSFRRGTGWPIRPRSAGEASLIANAAGWRDVLVGAAGLPLGPGRGVEVVTRIYDKIRLLPVGSAISRAFGPLWEMHAVRGEAS